MIHEKKCPQCGKNFYCKGRCKRQYNTEVNECWCPQCVKENPDHMWIHQPEDCPREFTKEKVLGIFNPSLR